MKKTGIRKWYVDFIGRASYRGFDRALYFFLYLLSLVYAAAAAMRNFCFDSGICRFYRPQKPVISVGNISWGGSGKTTLVLKLLDNLADRKTAVLRRGYGRDEEMIFRNRTEYVYSAKDRVGLVKKHQGDFDCFILDDGFQYRKLGRRVNIVVMAAREFIRPIRLIPASIFREPLCSLRRADMAVITYKSELKDYLKLKASLERQFKNCSFYGADYRPVRIADAHGEVYAPGDLAKIRTAAVTAVGYPQGFFAKLREFGVTPCRQIVYPDHHEFDAVTAQALYAALERDGIRHLIVTVKDKNRFGLIESKVKILILEVEMVVEDEAAFINEIKTRVKV